MGACDLIGISPYKYSLVNPDEIQNDMIEKLIKHVSPIHYVRNIT
jgi:hypothetical protein